MTAYPPPDLAIEVDVTSKTQLSAYEALRVPELWRYEQGKLQINVLRDGKCAESRAIREGAQLLSFQALTCYFFANLFELKGMDTLSATSGNWLDWFVVFGYLGLTVLVMVRVFTTQKK